MTAVDENGEFVCNEDGTRTGDKIPGSRFARAFCQHCHEAIRVPTERVLDSYCVECEPIHRLYQPNKEMVKGIEHLVDYTGINDGSFGEWGNQ